MTYLIVRIIIELKLLKKEALHSHRRPATIVAHLRYGLGNDQLQNVCSAIGEIIGTGHG